MQRTIGCQSGPSLFIGHRTEPSPEAQLIRGFLLACFGLVCVILCFMGLIGEFSQFASRALLETRWRDYQYPEQETAFLTWIAA